MREKKIDNVISQIDTSNLIDEIEHKLRSEKLNKVNQEWERIGKVDIGVSEILIARLVSFMSAILNQNTTLSNYSINEINNRMELIIEYLRDDLADNDEEYVLVVRDTEKTRICVILCETTSIVFRRALGGMESRRIFSSLKVTESLTSAPKGQTMKEAMQFWK